MSTCNDPDRLTDKLCKGRHLLKENVFFRALPEWRGGGGAGLPMPEFFGPLFRSAFLVNKKSLFLQKCQWGSVARRLGQMPSILLQGDNNQLPLLQGDTAHTNFFYFSFKGTHTNYLYYSFKGTHRAHTLTFSTSLQWGTHQTTSTSTILPILILLLLLFLSL